MKFEYLQETYKKGLLDEIYKCQNELLVQHLIAFSVFLI